MSAIVPEREYQGHWMAWQGFRTDGTPGCWSMNHFTEDDRTTLCGVRIPGRGWVFNRDRNPSPRDRDCKHCERKLNLLSEVTS